MCAIATQAEGISANLSRRKPSLTCVACLHCSNSKKPLKKAIEKKTKLLLTVGNMRNWLCYLQNQLEQDSEIVIQSPQKTN